MKKLLIVMAIFAGLIWLLASPGISGAAEKYNWKIGHIRPEGTAIDKDVRWFVEKLKKDSGGQIEIKIYPASQLGDYTVVQERCSLGDVEMQLACLGTTVDRRLMIQTAPYLAKNWNEARQLYASGSLLMKRVGDMLAQQNIHLISGWPVYFGGICLTKEPPSPGDPDVPKNIKIRVPPIKSYELTAQALGYLATPIPWADTFPAMQTGIVNGAIGGGAEGYYANFRDLMKYYLAVNDHFEMWYLYINMDLWKKLSAAHKKMIQSAADEMEKRRWSVAEQDEINNMKRLSDAGIKVITFTDEELSKMTKKIRTTVWPAIRPEIGKEIFDQITSSLK
jgi:TRAP-type C4-dicarboxylate transport system substrate-binding protein